MVKDENAEWLFGGENGNDGQWEAHRRFISEQFNAVYRQGVIGAHHLPEAEFSEFLLKAAVAPAEAVEKLLRWIQTSRPQGGDYGDVAMDRIAARAAGFDRDTAVGVVKVFSEVMDDYYRMRPKTEMFLDRWEQSERILKTFRVAGPDLNLGDIAESLGRNGAALSWMAITIARPELMAGDPTSGRRSDTAPHQIPASSLRAFVTALIERFSALSIAEQLAQPRLGAMLFTFRRSPWHADAVAAIVHQMAGPGVSDEQFLTFLEAMAGVVISSRRGAYKSLDPDVVRDLLGETAFDQRWTDLLARPLSSELETRKKRVIAMMSEGEE